MLKKLPCQIYRGGTSKGPFFNRKDLPQRKEDWDPVFLSLMGSPDPRQIDGLGGSYSTTSKIAVISKADSDQYDVEYLFAQVSVDAPRVSYAGNCGNMSSAVGPYAIETGMVAPEDPVTLVRILNTNTGNIIYSYVPTPGGRITYEGDCTIAGVPKPGARIELQFRNPEGSVTGRLLPTGHVKDLLEVPGLGKIEVSIIDACNPLAFIRAKDVGMKGTELPADIVNDKEKLTLLENVRGAAAVACGFISEISESLTTPAVPKLTLVSAPQDYIDGSGNQVSGKEIDLCSRMMSMQKMHNSYAFTGALCTAVAAAIPGSIVHELMKKEMREIVIGHAAGTLTAGVHLDEEALRNGEIRVLDAYGVRTARKLMEGNVFYCIGSREAEEEEA